MVQPEYQYQNSYQTPVEANSWNGRPRDDYSYHMKQSNMVDQSSVVMVRFFHFELFYIYRSMAWIRTK